MPHLLIVLAGVVALAWAQTACARHVPKVAVVLNTPRLSELESVPPTRPGARAFFEGMAERGWVHGRNVQLVWRSAEQRPERFPVIMEELVRLKVDMIVVSGNRAAREARAKTRAIPIVLGNSEFAAEEGLVESYARPGANITGVSSLVYHLDAKRLFLLKDLSPSITRVAVLGQISAERGDFGRETREAIRSLGLTAFHVPAHRGEDIPGAFAEAIRKGADAMIISSTGPMQQPENQAILHALAIKHRIPVLHSVLAAVETGGLIAYASDEREVWRRAAHYVDRILRGDNPATMPIEHPRSYHLHINRKAAAAIGLQVPPLLLTQADKLYD